MSADPPDPAVDVDTLVERLRQVVEDRRRAGEYPPDLERDLDAHFRRIAARAQDMGDLQGLLTDVRLAAEIAPERISYVSSLPLGTTVHKTFGKAVRRQTQGVVTQVNGFARAVLILLEAVVQTRPVHETALSDLNARLDAVMERMGDYERVPADASPDLRALVARVDRLERETRPVHGARPYSRAALRRALVGTREQVLEQYRPLAELFRDAGPVIDAGCGGGEMLELLSGLGLEARGVDDDPEVVEEVAARDLLVTRGDPLGYLQSMPDQALGGVCLDRVLEELSPERAVEVLSTTTFKLRPGGRLLVIGTNPDASAESRASWYADPSRVRPFPGRLVELLLEQWGYREITTEVLSPPPTIATTAVR
jgi:SAM-dependent methyltransferase